MHDEPCLELHYEPVCQYRENIGVAGSKRILTDTDAETGANGGKLREVAVCLQRKAHVRQAGCAGDDCPDRRRLAVIADQAVAAQIGKRGRGAAPVEVSPVGVKTERHRADMKRHQRILTGHRHAHGNIRLLPQDVLDRIGSRQLDGQIRILHMQLGKDRRQHLDTDHFAGTDAHRSADRILLAGGSAKQGR